MKLSSGSTQPNDRFSSILAAILCAAFIALSAMPVVFRWAAGPEPPWNNYSAQPLDSSFPFLILGALILVLARLDPERGSWKVARHAGFVLVAGLLTDIHFHTVDVFHLPWQWDQYNRILNHVYQPPD